MAGQYSTPALGMYSASKWAVEAAFEALAQKVAEFNVQTTIVEPGGIRTNFAGGHGVFSKPMSVYNDTDAGKITALISGRVPAPAGMENSILGDPDKMAEQIIKRVEQGQGPLRLALGSDSYNKMHEGLEKRLIALEDQKGRAGITDYK
ncbi:hypothetical protein IV88_GL001289 [Pediococcus argentinicus]|uniref:Short chain dehydrogenase n=1 Tax=Pediococcus argentinicus TaxID=480391 RepID=A0A0R2N8K4_9LACO|nr:hypothetical protein IV88_GL001289 [Pediococcus argentinicus]GEP20197.1 hypothetical protein LSA03_15810 [Pediococcus argentinicus]